MAPAPTGSVRRPACIGDEVFTRVRCVYVVVGGHSIMSWYFGQSAECVEVRLVSVCMKCAYTYVS